MTVPTASEPATRPVATHDFLGHPRGLAVLFATEAWERFSYFGNAALVVLYMTKYLFDAGRPEAVLGLGPVRAALEFLFGRLDAQLSLPTACWGGVARSLSVACSWRPAIL